MPESDDELRPVAESREAFDWLASYGRDRQLETSVLEMGRRVRETVPDCFALSLGLVREGVTFTLVSESREAALLDAVQYLDGGPCEAAITDGRIIATEELAPDDEQDWQLFAQGWSVAGVSSTLSLPVMRADRTVGSVNLYASTPNAFDGHHAELAEACGAWAQGAVTNADLSFTSRVRAAAAPSQLRERSSVQAAAGFLAAKKVLDVETAAARIRDAASRAGVREADVARFVLDSHARQVERHKDRQT